MHGYWLREHAIDGAYVALPVPRCDLSGALTGLRKSGFTGVNLTLPHKEAAFAMAHTADAAAQATWAANLLLFRELRIDASNTDVEGLVRSLREGLGKQAFGVRRVVVLGAGGAARAAVLACDRLGMQEILVVNRTRARADALVRTISGSLNTKLAVAGYEAWEAFAPPTQLLINATSAGLNGMPLLNLSLELLSSDAAVCDLVYNPLETPLLAQARARGLTTIDGLGMLMHQGALAFESLFGVRPHVSSELRAHLEQALRDEP
jgi:shikimate dehydrogenase